jgi:excisionase family DNA binding protein
MMPTLEPRYLSVADAARYLGLSSKSLYIWAEKGTIPAYKVGRLWRFDKTELDQFVRCEKRPNTVLYNRATCSEPEREGV